MSDATEILQRIIAATYSHIDGRDLLAELHPRKTLDIKRRVDGRETWHEGDWLSTLYNEIKMARAHLNSDLFRTRQPSSRVVVVPCVNQAEKSVDRPPTATVKEPPHD